VYTIWRMEEGSSRGEDHVPVITGNYHPFRLVLREEDEWCPTIEEINRRTYDYVKLHRMSAFVDIGILPLSLGVRFDGTLVLPATQELINPETALHHFNRFLCHLLLGGIYCESVSPDDICLGRMTHSAYCKISGNNRGDVSRLHQGICMTGGGVLDTIRLLQPETIAVAALRQALSSGRERFGKVSPLVPETFLHGTTYYARNQWSDALIHLWTSIEQVVQGIWKEQLLAASDVRGISTRRRKSFLSDQRTWSASTRLELLYQKSLIPDRTYTLLDVARRSRNAFAHTGAISTARDAEAALDGLLQLMSLRMTSYAGANSLECIREIVANRSRLYAAWERRGKPLEGVTHWLPIPPVPGDPGWGDAPYEIIEELRLRELKRPLNSREEQLH